MRRRNRKPNSKWHTRKKMFKSFERRVLTLRFMMKFHFEKSDLNYEHNLRLHKVFA